MTTNCARYAQNELSVLAATVPDAILTPFADEIIALAEKFGKSGQSGGSAPTTATVIGNAIKSLLLFEPICDITGIEEEWMDVTEYCGGNSTYQNKREGSLFKLGKDGRPYYLDAIIIKTQTGQTLTCNSGAFLPDGSKIYSRNYVKSFPFKPKTFYIDVIEMEVAKDDWVYCIKEPKQLNKVFKYYDRYEDTK